MYGREYWRECGRVLHTAGEWAALSVKSEVDVVVCREDGTTTELLLGELAYCCE